MQSTATPRIDACPTAAKRVHVKSRYPISILRGFLHAILFRQPGGEPPLPPFFGKASLYAASTISRVFASRPDSESVLIMIAFHSHVHMLLQPR